MALESLNHITIDVSAPLNTPVVKAVQEDIRSRYVEIALVSNGEPLVIPAGTLGMVGLRRPNNTYVLYDETEDETPAVTIDGNVVTVYLSQEALAVNGSIYTSVTLYSNDGRERLTAFHFMTNVEETAVPSGVVIESDYFNILQGMIEDAIDAADRAEQAAATFQSHASTHLQTGSDPIPLGTTTAAGLIQLYNGVDSDSTTMAATAAAVKAAYNHGGGGGGGTQANWAETDPLDPSYIQNKPTSMTPTAHASTHAANGTDPLTPADIGAMAANATPTPAAHAASHAENGSDPITPASIGAMAVGDAPTAHAASHASNGSDPITPASIGAMAANATPTPAAHAASHALGGTDALTPAAIGAAAATHASTHEIGGTDPLPAASTSQAGLVQIYDGVDSTSTTMAASANAVRLAYNHGGGGGGGATLLRVTASAVSSLPVTISNADITAQMVVVQYTLSAPYVQTGDWTVTTASGTATVSGSMSSSGSTDIELILAEV